ncbi:hypothetical protein BD311DRAFT_283758 [Dichomitus squalens]|uniref:Secreted protein n=1 Tax=Dichomitus squalens TaxID=114155 RepID=A0A4Q9N2S9_9APHY|nr:hypothetical protein BD311DRAFT_283758 [Dichomitus squalens]
MTIVHLRAFPRVPPVSLVLSLLVPPLVCLRHRRTHAYCPHSPSCSVHRLFPWQRCTTAHVRCSVNPVLPYAYVQVTTSLFLFPYPAVCTLSHSVSLHWRGTTACTSGFPVRTARVDANCPNSEPFITSRCLIALRSKSTVSEKT